MPLRIRWVLADAYGRRGEPAFSRVHLVSRNLDLASPEDVKRAEKSLGCSFPKGYQEYVTTLGDGTYSNLIRVYLPERVISDLPEWRERVEEFCFWHKGKALLTKERVLQCIVIADTLNGDEIVFHPSAADAIYLLPRGGEDIHAVGKDLSQAIDWICTSPLVTQDKQTFRYFESHKDRHTLRFEGTMSFDDYRSRFLSLKLHDKIVVDSREEDCLVALVPGVEGDVSYFGEQGITVEFDKGKKGPALDAVVRELVALGYKLVEGDDEEDGGEED